MPFSRLVWQRNPCHLLIYSLGKSCSVHKRDCCEFSCGGGGFGHTLTPPLKASFYLCKQVSLSLWALRAWEKLMAVLKAAWALGNKQDCSSSTHLRCRMLFHVLLSPPKPLEGKTKQNKNQKRWLELVMQCHKQGWGFFVPRKHLIRVCECRSEGLFIPEMLSVTGLGPKGSPWSHHCAVRPLGRGHVTGGGSPIALWGGCCSPPDGKLQPSSSLTAQLPERHLCFVRGLTVNRDLSGIQFIEL